MSVRQIRFSQLLAVIGAGLVFVGLASGTPQGFVLAAVTLLCLALQPMASNRGGTLFGPLAVWDLTRVARDKKTYFARSLISFWALPFLGLTYLDNRDSSIDSSMIFNSWRFAKIAESLVVYIGLLSVAISCPATLILFSALIVEERESGRLDHLLTTDLTNREIVIGKTLGRMAVLFMYLLTLLPILVVLTVLGGDPNLILVGCVFLGFSLLGLIGICLASSARARSSSAAIVQSIAIMALLLASLYAAHFAFKWFDLSWKLAWLDAVGDFLDDLSPLRMIQDYQRAHATRLTVSNVLQSLGHFAAMQWLLFVLGWSYASWSLRQPPRSKKAIAQGEESSAIPVTRNRPPVSDQPVLWYEMHHSSYAIGRYWNRFQAKGLLPLITILLVYLFSFVASDVSTHVRESYYGTRGKGVMPIKTFPEVYTDILWLSGPVAWLTIVLPAGLRAARLVARERQRDTLDSLLLTSLETDQILAQKSSSVFRHTHAPCSILFTLWGIGYYLGCINAYAFVLFFLVTATNIALVVSLGLLCSVRSKTPLIAMSKFVVVLCAWFALDWIFSFGTPIFDQKNVFLCLLSPLQVYVCTTHYILWGEGDMYWGNLIVPLFVSAGLMVSSLATFTAFQLSFYWFRHQVCPIPNKKGMPS